MCKNDDGKERREKIQTKPPSPFFNEMLLGMRDEMEWKHEENVVDDIFFKKKE